LILILRISVK